MRMSCLDGASQLDTECRLNELRDLLAERSIRKGSFVLASGRPSHYYCDTKATVLSPRGSQLTGEILYRILADRGVEAVGGLAMGAVYIATSVSLVSAMKEHPIYGFTVRESQKGHGLRKVVEESYHPDGTPLLRAGRKIAVVDDVVTTGGSIFKAIEAVKERGCQIEAVIAILDRHEGGGRQLLAEGLPYFSLFSSDSEGNVSINADARDPRPH